MAKQQDNELKRKILRRLEPEKKGMSSDALASALKIKRADRARFLLTLERMEQQGTLLRGKKGKYTAAGGDCLRARMMSLSRGFGFARPEEGGDDLFIPGRSLGGALPGDTVLLRVRPGDERGPQGEVLQVVEKGDRLYTGRLVDGEDKRPEVRPDALLRFSLPVHGLAGRGNGKRNKAKESDKPVALLGDKVRFSVDFDKEGVPFARVVTSYGRADSARICADAIVDAAGIPSVFPVEVREQAERLRDAGIAQGELNGREDLRDWTIFTIDGRDAKDLDDAVSLQRTETGWRLGVHIADVSHYVREKTPLDREAFSRGTSVYFADRVIPMLPEALSNGACSLNAGEDKLAFSAVMELDRNGNLLKTALYKSVIRSCLRGVYSEINALFDGSADEAVTEKYAPVRETLDDMRTLAARLRDAAARRGTMDLISAEPQFTLDDQGHPVDIVARETGESEGMIEQFMIAANVATAAFARRRGLPFVYRVHEQPDPEKLQALGEIARRLGFKSVRLSAQLDLRGLMEEARETRYARLISDRLLRSMAKAQYSDNPLGHFGLSLADYCHFTSPIRRYPDLCVHRILTDALSGVPKDEMIRRYTSFVREAADQSSRCEVRAMTAERDCEACYMAEYMSGFLGKTFDCVVSSVSSFGIFVELPNAVEGLVRLETLPEEGLRYDEAASLVDSHGRPVYTVGDPVTVRVDAVDVSSGRIDFTPAAKNAAE